MNIHRLTTSTHFCCDAAGTGAPVFLTERTFMCILMAKSVLLHHKKIMQAIRDTLYDDEEFRFGSDYLDQLTKWGYNNRTSITVRDAGVSINVFPICRARSMKIAGGKPIISYLEQLIEERSKVRGNGSYCFASHADIHSEAGNKLTATAKSMMLHIPVKEFPKSWRL